MSVEILMPQMGESVAEGTIVRWIKQVGDAVDKDEPLFEISTDKVDAEIPSPGAGILVEIRVSEGETVPVNSVVAIIGSHGAAVVDRSGASPVSANGPSASPSHREARLAREPMSSSGPAVPVLPDGPALPDLPVVPEPVTPAAAGASVLSGVARVSGGSAVPASRFSSPVVRRLAKEYGVDVSRVSGTGAGGRVTRRDIESYVAKGGGRKPPAVRQIEFAPGAGTHVEKMSVMRRKIADHMVASIRTSAHIYSAYEADFSQIDRLRRIHKSRYEAAGTSLTFTSFVTKAVATSIREFPYINASLDGENVVYKREINIGIAVALEQGLIVPVIRRADSLSMLELAHAIQDLAHRARTKQLKVEDVEGGTFTVTNPGVFGGLWGLPIISQPQVAILAVGSIDKRAAVVDDEIVVRPMCYLTLGYDHRLVDGADGGRFLQALKMRLEDFDESWL